MQLLQSPMLGNNHIALETVDSTNAYARRLLLAEGAEGTVVTAQHQTAGRGRLDRQWVDVPGQSFLASYILSPRRDAEDWGGLPLLTGIAVLRTLLSITPLDLHLKWPNDVLIENRKICGILVESCVMDSTPWVIIGIGINLIQREFEGAFRLPPTSLLLESGRYTAASELLQPLSRQLTSLYATWTEEGNTAILEAWKQHSRMFGSRIELHTDEQVVPATALDLTAGGALRVQYSDGEIADLYAGDVSFPISDHMK
jgi:BirA family biotin operon repressor/biotin-[acetyl-CoA-carboxylase] ligase